MCRRDLGHVDLAVAHQDPAQLLASFDLAVLRLPEGRELGDLPAEGGGRGLAPGVRVHLCIQHEHVDIGSRGDHARQRLEADVIHRAVTAHDP